MELWDFERPFPAKLSGKSSLAKRPQHFTELAVLKREHPPAGLEPAIFGLEVRRLVH